MSNLLIIGAGGHAKSCIDLIESSTQYNVKGIVGLESQVGSIFMGYPVIGSDKDLKDLLPEFPNILIGIGQIKSPDTRIKIFELLRNLGFFMPTIVSPKAYVSKHASIGMGVVVMHGAIINAGATIGDNCIINSGALIEHDVKIGNNCHISTKAVLNGDAVIGNNVFIGSGAVIRNSVTIGSGSVITMSACIRADVPEGAFITLIGGSFEE